MSISLIYIVPSVLVVIQVSECRFSFPLQYPWMHHLSTIFSKNTLKDDEEIIVPALPYLQNMTRIIKETPKRYRNHFCFYLHRSKKMGIVKREYQIIKVSARVFVRSVCHSYGSSQIRK